MIPCIKIAQGDVTNVSCDVLFLKNADGFYGADAKVAKLVGFDTPLDGGEWIFLPGSGLAAKAVLFGGVGPLIEFRYAAIRSFAATALKKISESLPEARRVACTIHGPGYGLDEKEAFQALLAGLLDGAAAATRIDEIQIVELDERRVQRLKPLLSYLSPARASVQSQTAQIVRPNFSSVGRGSESKPRLFVAMPFSDDYADEFEIAFMEASGLNGFLCERADMAFFTGDIIEWVRLRIETSCGLIALMNNGNPNVFLEIGYAWAKGVPTILVLKQGQTAPFNVKGQRFVEYARIGDLRTKLTEEIGALKKQGILTPAGLPSGEKNAFL